MSIKFKLIVSVALAMLVVMLSGGAVMLWNFQEIQQQHISRIQDNMRMLNREFVSVLIETDIEVAADLSSRLESLDNVLNLFLRDDDGTLRYSYQRDAVEDISPPETGAEYVHMADNYIEIVRPVVYNELGFGTVYLRSSMDNIVENKKGLWLFYRHYGAVSYSPGDWSEYVVATFSCNACYRVVSRSGSCWKPP